MLGCITVALEKSEDEIRIRTMIPRGTEADLVFREKIVKLPEGLHEEIFCT